jgi:flagellar protein FliO/FliZ
VELAGYSKFLMALVFVLGLIWLLAALARRMGFGFPVAALKGRGRRLSVIEVTPVDARRRLVLVRRDDTEHLILLGQAGELVIETGIPARRDMDAAPAKDAGKTP